MSPRTTQGPGTRAELLEAALFCFAERGYEGTSLRMVADRAGKHMSLIAHHFGNKDGLYKAVFEETLTRRGPYCFQGPVVPFEALQDDPERAATLIRELVIKVFLEMRTTFACSDPQRIAGFRLWMNAVHAPLPDLEPLMKERLSPLRLQFAACIQALRPDLPVAEIPFWCALIYGQCLVNTMHHRFNTLVFGAESFPEDATRMAEQIADITLRAIGRPETT